MSRRGFHSLHLSTKYTHRETPAHGITTPITTTSQIFDDCEIDFHSLYSSFKFKVRSSKFRITLVAGV